LTCELLKVVVPVCLLPGCYLWMCYLWTGEATAAGDKHRGEDKSEGSGVETGCWQVWQMPWILARLHSLNILRTTAATAVVRLSHRISVCLSHGWISQKWCKLELPNFHLQLLGRL